MDKRKQRHLDLEERLIDFAVRILELVETLPKLNTAKHMGGQLMRSGTSPALNYGEAQGAESREDFVHKMKICLKELRESYNNLRIIKKKNWFAEKRLDPLIRENNELVSIFVTSLKTVTKN